MLSDLIGDAGLTRIRFSGCSIATRATSPGGSSPSTAGWRPCPTAPSGYPSATFFLAIPGSSVYHNPTLSVIRKRALGRGRGEDLYEKLTVLNSGRGDRHRAVDRLRRRFCRPVRGQEQATDQNRHHLAEVRGQAVELIYRREDFERRTVIRADGAQLSQDSAVFRLRLKPAESWSGTLQVSFESVAPRERTGAAHELPSSEIKRPRGVNHRDQMDAWLKPHRSCEPAGHPLRLTYDRSLRDLPRTHRLRPPHPEGDAIPAARLPWYMAVFGRDSLITSYQALPFVPQLASATLQVLAHRQATAGRDFKDAEPGKILHELRFGELTYFGDWPRSPYYGSADSTPLFLILLDEYERWSGDTDLVVELEPQARAALNWLEHHGDLDGDGYLEYQRRSLGNGLENQCWKDSATPSCTPMGSWRGLPRASCELQGYAYDARIRTARLAREMWHDDATANRLNVTRPISRPDSTPTSGSPMAEFFALALDGDKQRVPTLTSNMGHLLWSGIVDDSKVDAVRRPPHG